MCTPDEDGLRCAGQAVDVEYEGEPTSEAALIAWSMQLMENSFIVRAAK